MPLEYLEHTTSLGDRWDLIAFTYYGDGTKIVPLLKANPDLLGSPKAPTPLTFKSGVLVRVPVLTDKEIVQTQLPPWKKP